MTPGEGAAAAEGSAGRLERIDLRTFLHYLASVVYRRVLALLGAIVKPKVLAPELYGLLNLLVLIPEYATFTQLGVRNALRYRYTAHAASGEHETNRDLVRTVFVSTLVTMLIVSTAIVVVAFAHPFRPVTRIGLCVMAAYIMLGWCTELQICLLKAMERFRFIIIGTYVRSTITFLGVGLVLIFGIYGVYTYMLVSAAAVFVVYRSGCRIIQAGRFRLPLLGALIRDGFPMMVLELMTLLISSTDRIIIANMLGATAVGHYAIATMVCNAIMELPGTARDIVEPKMMRAIATSPVEEAVREYFLRPLLHTAYYLPWVIGPLFFFFPVVVPWFLPRYQPGILPMQILVFGVYFFSLTYASRGILIAMRRQTQAAVIMGVLCIVNGVLSVTLVRCGFGIGGVAFGSAVAYVLLLVALLTFIRKRIAGAVAEWREAMLACAWPAVAMVSAVIVLYAAGIRCGLPAWLVAGLQSAVYGAMMLAVVRAGHRACALVAVFRIPRPGWRRRRGGTSS